MSIGDISKLIKQIAAIVTDVVGYGLLLLIAAAVLQKFGFRVPYTPGMNVTELCYLAGAWYLYRK